MPNARLITACLAAALAFSGSAAAQAAARAPSAQAPANQHLQSPPLAGPPNCRFAIPAPLLKDGAAAGATWLGSCLNGRAEGSGVIRMATASLAGPTLFLGRVHAGLPVTGFLRQHYPPNGDTGVRHFDAQLQPADDDLSPGAQDASVWAAAAAGARQASLIYAQQGNKASAAFYRDLAHWFGRGPAE